MISLKIINLNQKKHTQDITTNQKVRKKKKRAVQPSVCMSVY